MSVLTAVPSVRLGSWELFLLLLLLKPSVLRGSSPTAIFPNPSWALQEVPPLPWAAGSIPLNGSFTSNPVDFSLAVYFWSGNSKLVQPF